MDIFKKDFIVGLDIGSSSVKMALFSLKEAVPVFVRSKLSEIKLPAGEEESAAAVRDAVNGIDLRRSKVVVNINCPQTSIKKITAPYMPKSELRDGILLEAKNYFPFSIDDAIVDFEITGDVIDKGIRKYEVSVAVCPADTSNKYLKILEKAGVKPASFISTPYALERIANMSGYPESKTVSYVDIGKRYTELIITRNKALVFSRKIPVAGDDFTRSLTSTLASDKGRVQLSTEEAEAVKKEAGIPKEGDNSMVGGKVSRQQVLSMIISPLEQLVSEVNRCFDYYREEGGTSDIDSVILSGGGASLGGLTTYLSENLGLPVRLCDPVSALKCDAASLKEVSGYAHRIGLAIGAVSGAGGGINLLPVEVREATTRVVKRGSIEVAITAAVIISILLYTGIQIRITALEKRIETARFELKGLGPQLAKAEAQALAGSVLLDEPEWEDVFKELSNLVPENIHLTDMRLDNKVITINGVVASEHGEEVLSGFILTLEKGLFNNVKLVETNALGEKPGIEFELKCWVDYE